MKLSAAQRQALDLSHSLLVRAGAGSGKTTLLVARYLALFERDPALEPGRVLALSFTEKAASEMEARIRERLDRPGHEISTIHAFCARLLARHDPRVGVELQDAGRRRSRLAALLDRTLLALEWEAPHRLRSLAECYSREALLRMLDALFDRLPLARRWSAALLRRHPDAESAAGARAAELPRLCALLAARVRADPAWARLERALARDPLEHLLRLREALVASPLLSGGGPAVLRRHLQDLLGLIDRSRGAWRARPELSARLAPELEDFRELLLRRRPPQEAEAVERIAASAEHALAWLFDHCDRADRAAREAEGLVDFDDLVCGAVRLLEDDPALAESLRARYAHILVDEFQDTDGEQWRLVRLLAGEPVPPGKLFLVGDEKQSIYRFRGADVSVFNAARAGFRSATLDENYRSRGGLIEFCNRAFARIFAAEGAVHAPHEARPQALVPGRPEQAGGGRVALLVTELVDPPPAEEDLSAARATDDPDAQEAASVAGLLHALHARGRPYEQIAVLLRTRGPLPALRAALEEAGIPHLVWRGSGFYEAQEVRDLVALLRCVADPADSIARAAVLRGPIAGLSDAGLYHLLGPGDPGALSERDQRAARNAAALFARCAELAPTTPVAEWLYQALETSGALLAYAERPDAEQALANVEKLLSIVRELDASHGLHEIARLLDGLVAAGHPEGVAPVALEGRRGVRVMTVHAAKGLQFPVVVLPGLARPSRPAGAGRLRIEELPELGPQAALSIPADALLAAGLPPRERPVLRSLLDAQAEALERAESKRLLYVACTRAEDELYFSAALRRTDEGWVSPSPSGRAWEWWSLLEPLAAGLEQLAGRPAPSAPPAPAARPVQPGPPAPRPPATPVIQADLLERYRECPRRYYYAAVLGLSALDPIEPVGVPFQLERDGLRIEGHLPEANEELLGCHVPEDLVAAIVARRFEPAPEAPCERCGFSTSGVCDSARPPGAFLSESRTG